MKLSRFLICGLTALAAAICLHACSEDDPVNPDPDPTPVVDPDNGEVTFVITNESGSGTGTVDAPAEVSNGDTLSMVISQKSSYTDSDGTVFTCEPEAKFSIHAVMDTVYAQNEDLLTKIEDSEVTTSKEGTNPVRNLTKQTIKVGPQSIKAEMLNEVYTYINKAQQAIEMPYARWNELSAESPSADEREEDAQQTKADVNIAKTAVTLTPLAQTRAIVSDTTLYNVNLRLYGEVEVKNAKNETKQPIVIDVNYIGAVVSSMEIPDEDNGEVSFEIESDGIQGEGTAASPYIITPENALNLVIRQKSRYTDIDGSTFEREPLATINASLGKDVVYAESLDLLTSLAGEAEVNTSEEGDNPVRHAITQAYDLGGMPIDFALGYEVYPYTTQAGETIEMPYGKLNPASYGGTRTQEASAKYAARISEPAVSAVPQTRATVSDTTMYDITATFRVELESVNAKETSKRAFVFAVTYPAGVITEKEVEDPDLVRVEYRTGYTWEEAHDNLPLLYYATVYRDRYYSNGEVITDTFVDVGHMVAFSASRDPEKAGSYSPEDEISIIYSEQTKNSDDQHLVIQCSLQVSDIEALSTEIGRDESDPAGNWNEYVISKTYDDNSFISASDVPCNQEWGMDNRQQGWYFNDCGFIKRLHVCYQGKKTIYRGMCCYEITMAVYDQFLVIDGRRIDFLEYRPDFHFNLLTKDIPNGIEHTYECNFEFMGRDFYVAVINTITQL